MKVNATVRSLRSALQLSAGPARLTYTVMRRVPPDGDRNVECQQKAPWAGSDSYSRDDHTLTVTAERAAS